MVKLAFIVANLAVFAFFLALAASDAVLAVLLGLAALGGFAAKMALRESNPASPPPPR